MFFVLSCSDPAEGYIPRVEYESDSPFRFWNTGEKFDEDPKSPIKAHIVSDEKTTLPEMWLTPLPLMSIRLYDILSNSGVTNFQIFPAELTDRLTGQLITNRYFAFNLLGLISALDLKQAIVVSREPITGLKGDIDIDRMVVDSNRALGADLFRLAEESSVILVSQRLREIIEAAGIDTLTFTRPEHWVT